ncbi:MAG: hypothetical protein K9K67_01000 [Bacteriovoracaceae bacterium]|nr:hypothetical protein [Bacteriovoracaceae bacterium]
MRPALLIGRKGSVGFPGKNTHPVNGRPLAWYPMQLAIQSKKIDHIFLSTDDPSLVDLGTSLGLEIIERPDYLATKEALGEDVFVHGFDEIKRRYPDKNIESIALLFCNCATATLKGIEKGFEILEKQPQIDSAVSVSRYNMWSPLRARRLSGDGTLVPMVPFELFGDPENLNCDRDSQGDVWFADMGFSIVRPKCLESIQDGLLPQKWMGQKIAPVEQDAGFDMDYEWQLPAVEWWLNKFSDLDLKN